MPDFLLRGIDNALAERIKTIAREKNWAINDVILHLIRAGLGDGVEAPGTQQASRQDIAHLSGTWAPDEAAAFRAALAAFETLPEDESPVHAQARVNTTG